MNRIFSIGSGVVNKLFLFSVFFNLDWMLIYAEPKYPVDISYLVSDFKYSQEHGLKICEVQHGSLSALRGDRYIAGEDGIIPTIIADFFALFPQKKWAASLSYPPLKKALEAKGWEIESSLQGFLKDPIFLKSAALPPVDPYSLSSYSGFVFADLDILRNFESYSKAYPGILFLNAVTLPYWCDKYKMSALFASDPELQQYKADWRLYPRKYDRHLSERIQEEMPSEFYVIKPRRGALGSGVIVVASADLDTVLQMILEPLPSLEKHPDKKYSCWWKKTDTTFLIEKYYRSDYLSFSQPLSGNAAGGAEYHYDATMRIAFILQYDGKEMTYHSLGGFWKLPSKALEEEGTLNERSISCGRPPFYRAIDPDYLNEVNVHMERAMLLLYEKMLNEAVIFETTP